MSFEPACSLFCSPVPPVTTPITPQPNFILNSPLDFVRATDDERITVGCSSRIDGGDEVVNSNIR